MLLDKVRNTVTCYNMLQKGDRVMVGVSGGPDSIALLHILNDLRSEFELALTIGHLNHLIRKRAAEKDAEFVRRTAKELDLPVLIESKDIPKVAKMFKLSIEEAARDYRYKFYLSAAKKFNADKIALGHTRDDQAETILMRLIRGSGLLGLGGIPPVRKFENKTIIRPLIEVSKKEILKFLSKRKISFRQDETNLKPIYLRNRIRRRLLPFLEKEFNPDIREILNETAENLRSDYSYLSKVVEKKFKYYARFSKDTVKVSLRILKEDEAIQRMIVREAVRLVKGDLHSVAYRHWRDLKKLLNKKFRWQMSLPGRILVKRQEGNLVFCKAVSEKKNSFKDVIYQLKIPGRTEIPEIDKVIEADFLKRVINFKKKSKWTEYFDFDKLKPPLSIRFKKSGDKLIPLGMTKYKRLKRLFIDEKVPFEKRSRVPLVVSGGKIIWVCGVKRADYGKITAVTKKVLRLRLI